MSTILAEMSSGFRDPVHGAQQTFRTLLDAMAHPGRVLELPRAALDGIEPPASATPGQPMSAGGAAVLLALLDAETTVRVTGSLASASALAYLRFHTGVRPAWLEELATFTLARAGEVNETLWSRLDLGSDEAPQRGATLVVEVDALGDKGASQLRLHGPGIESTQALGVSGLSRAFWTWRCALERRLPRGIDLVLVRGTRLAAIPRTTRIALEA